MIEAQGNYSNIYLLSGTKILTSKSLKYWSINLNDNTFLRIHAKYFIRIDYITLCNKNT
ncbi:MAG: LytTR family transcriptional regulator DNA-binding domain-containing protein [Saprospiraceae bacterium]|nr:LytTR family transcriptional regulator DNA-binding domain-containing protein [Saprospiraceae bacterium]